MKKFKFNHNVQYADEVVKDIDFKKESLSVFNKLKNKEDYKKVAKSLTDKERLAIILICSFSDLGIVIRTITKAFTKEKIERKSELVKVLYYNENFTNKIALELFMVVTNKELEQQSDILKKLKEVLDI